MHMHCRAPTQLQEAARRVVSCYKRQAFAVMDWPKPLCPSQQAHCHCAVVPASAANNQTKPSFRYWVDYEAWKKGATAVHEEALQTLGGQNVGMSDGAAANLDLLAIVLSNPLAKLKTPYGYANIHSWDLYLTGARQLSLVHGRLQPGQLVCSQPGSAAVAAKSSLVPTLQTHYGHVVASRIAPRSFRLPAESQKWREWISLHPEKVSACSPPLLQHCRSLQACM